MFQKILHSVTISLLSLLILVSGVDFSFEKHICLAKESNTTFDSSTNCCAENNTNSCRSNDFNPKKSCCKNESNDIFSTISNTNESCDIDCCINIVTVVKGIKIVQVSLKKIEIQSPVFQAINELQQPFVSYKNYSQKLTYRYFHPPTHTVSFNILYRVFRI